MKGTELKRREKLQEKAQSTGEGKSAKKKGKRVKEKGKSIGERKNAQVKEKVLQKGKKYR